MNRKTIKRDFFVLLSFLIISTLLLSNGFVNRIFAQDKEVDVYEQVEPFANVLTAIMKNYVEDPDVDKVVEGALGGMMHSLDPHSSYMSAKLLEELTEDTEGEFDGIGIHIMQDKKTGVIWVFQPISGSPAAKAGMIAGDKIIKIDGISTEGMTLDDAADKLKGPSGTIVNTTILRTYDEEGRKPEEFEFDIKRGKIPLESIAEQRLLKGGIGYIRLTDFKKKSSRDIRKAVKELGDQGMKSLILDLRWNTGGLLTASSEVCEIFLPIRTLVTYTKGRADSNGNSNGTRLRTQRAPALPQDFPMIVLANEISASAAEIVTGALQYYKRALIVGVKTYGKGSVQTIIPLRRPKGSALRLTTALYYTPADVTIHERGIKPDVPVPMERSVWAKLWLQMYASYRRNPGLDTWNHGSVTGNTEGEVDSEGVVLIEGEVDSEGKPLDFIEDIQLQKAVELLSEGVPFSELIAANHKSIQETQIAVVPKEESQKIEQDADSGVLNDR